MNNIVPFVANHEDDMHCVGAVFRMMHQYCLGSDVSWKTTDTLTKAVPGKGTWTFPMVTYFANKGLDVVHIENIDYRKLYEEGEQYLYNVHGKQTADFYIRNSNIRHVLTYIPEFLKTVSHETRLGTIEDITHLLDSGYLIGVEVNIRHLKGKEGFYLHFILLTGHEDNEIIFHDPGLPPVPNCKIAKQLFVESWGYEGSGREIIAVKKKK